MMGNRGQKDVQRLVCMRGDLLETCETFLYSHLSDFVRTTQERLRLFGDRNNLDFLLSTVVCRYPQTEGTSLCINSDHTY